MPTNQPSGHTGDLFPASTLLECHVADLKKEITDYEAVVNDPDTDHSEHILRLSDHVERLSRVSQPSHLRSGQDRILNFFRERVGCPVTAKELRLIAAGSSEWSRRVRELRTQEGWPIVTRMTGRPELPPGTYVLEEDKQDAPHDRNIPDDVRVRVLVRDQHACQHEGCGWTPSQRGTGDPRHRLELHHVEHHVDGGANDEANLVTLCNVHHVERHRSEGRDID